ncbi:transcription initiation factor IIB [Nitrosopumilus maritimus]|uniref:Transcription factor TFIIB cyclin-related n=1 Tax=Nitrosopumilus maritimus (strain SCM1) TaxID=436308 RepID=A9A2J8_NITMS|nr:transcription factor TFIIB [Nitrosopumilus maritimus]ABX13237.1 Transcription factor TFIIB cyclin-related [Nitrosopumilus maritimus SCM1]
MKQVLEYCFKNNHTSPITDITTGEICCSDCGTVIVEKTIDRSNGLPANTKEDFMNRTQYGPPTKIAISDMSKTSMISKKNQDSAGQKLHSDAKRHFSRLRLWDSRSKSDRAERNLVKAFSILDAYASNLGIPENAKEHAAYIYRKALEKNLIRGSSIHTMVAGSVYVTCKQLGIPRSADDTTRVSNISRRRLSKAYKRLVKNLDLKIDPSETDFVTQVANSLSVSEKTKRLAIKIINDVKKEKIHVGKRPLGITAAAVYLSAINYDEPKSMAKISKVTNISTVTIRKIIKLVRPFAAKYIKSIDVGITQ